MIFVTVGTHEQPFNRLLQSIDDLISSGVIKEEVIAQTGYCTYIPQNFKHQKFFPYDQMITNVKKARLTITHGGPSSFIMPLQFGKIPVVMPRQFKFGEHVNDHQLTFCQEVANQQHNIILVENDEELKTAIIEYKDISAKMQNSITSNNKVFNEDLEKMVQSLFPKK